MKGLTVSARRKNCQVWRWVSFFPQ